MTGIDFVIDFISVCIGAYGDINYSLRLAAEIPELLNESSGGVQIETFIRRRMKKFPLGDTKDRSNDDEKIVVEKLSCELLILELLYFWNALLSCNVLDLDRIIESELFRSNTISKKFLKITEPEITEEHRIYLLRL